MSSKRNLQSNTFWLFGKIRTLKVNFVSGASDQQDTADDTSQVACAFRNCSGKWSGIQKRLDIEISHLFLINVPSIETREISKYIILVMHSIRSLSEALL